MSKEFLEIENVHKAFDLIFHSSLLENLEYKNIGIFELNSIKLTKPNIDDGSLIYDIKFNDKQDSNQNINDIDFNKVEVCLLAITIYQAHILSILKPESESIKVDKNNNNYLSMIDEKLSYFKDKKLYEKFIVIGDELCSHLNYSSWQKDKHNNSTITLSTNKDNINLEVEFNEIAKRFLESYLGLTLAEKKEIEEKISDEEKQQIINNNIPLLDSNANITTPGQQGNKLWSKFVGMCSDNKRSLITTASIATALASLAAIVCFAVKQYGNDSRYKEIFEKMWETLKNLFNDNSNKPTNKI